MLHSRGTDILEFIVSFLCGFVFAQQEALSCSGVAAQRTKSRTSLSFIYLSIFFFYVFILYLNIADAVATSRAIKQEREGGTDGTGWQGHEVSLRRSGWEGPRGSGCTWTEPPDSEPLTPLLCGGSSFRTLNGCVVCFFTHRRPTAAVKRIF